MIGARVFIVGPWVTEQQLEIDLREALLLLGGRLCRGISDGATDIVRVRAAGVERWIEVEAKLAQALLVKPSLRAFELLLAQQGGEIRAWLYRARQDPKGRGQLLRSDEEELLLPAGMDDEDRGDISGDLALKRIASLPFSAGNTSTRHIFVQIPP